MKQLPYLPLLDCFQTKHHQTKIGYENNGFGNYYPQQAYVKGFKKIQSVENMSMLKTTTSPFHSLKKINSVENMYPEGSNMDLNMSYFEGDADQQQQHNNHMAYLYNQINKTNTLVGKKKIADETDFRVKYKTEVCKNWALKGFCEFGDQCAFAHGSQEMREKIHISTNYKTKKCIQYHENSYCPYGQRCQFLHSLLTSKKSNNNQQENYSYEKEIESIDESSIFHNKDCICCSKRPRQRLPTFKSITECDDCLAEEQQQQREEQEQGQRLEQREELEQEQEQEQSGELKEEEEEEDDNGSIFSNMSNDNIVNIYSNKQEPLSSSD